jgi:hypothetical protein
MALSTRMNPEVSENEPRSNTASIDAVVFNDPGTQAHGSPLLIIKSLVDEAAVDVIRSSKSSGHEFHPAVLSQENILFVNREKSSRFSLRHSFRALLSFLNVSTMQFIVVMVACAIGGACVGLSSGGHKNSTVSDPAQMLRKESSVIVLYPYRDEQRALQKH